MDAWSWLTRFRSSDPGRRRMPGSSVLGGTRRRVGTGPSVGVPVSGQLGRGAPALYEILGLLFHRVDVVVVDSAVQVECALEAGAQIEGYEVGAYRLPRFAPSRGQRDRAARWCAIAVASRICVMGMGLRLIFGSSLSSV